MRNVEQPANAANDPCLLSGAVTCARTVEDEELVVGGGGGPRVAVFVFIGASASVSLVRGVPVPTPARVSTQRTQRAQGTNQ